MQHPRHRGGYYDETEIACWLTTLANHLRACQTREGGSGSDIYLQELWTAAGNRVPRYVAGALHAFLVLIPVLAIAWIVYGPERGFPQPWLSMVLGGGIVMVLWVFGRASIWPVSLKRLDLSQLRTSKGRVRVAVGFAGGFLFGFAISLTPPSSLKAGVSTGLGLGLALGLYLTATGRPGAISRPSQLVTQGLIHDLIILLGIGLVLGLSFLIAFSLQGALLGAAVGLTLGAVATSDSPWIRYAVATQILTHRTRLTRRLAPFLDWAYAAGLLRLAGIAIQFRHRELQDQLASIPSPTSQPENATTSATEEP